MEFAYFLVKMCFAAICVKYGCETIQVLMTGAKKEDSLLHKIIAAKHSGDKSWKREIERFRD